MITSTAAFIEWVHAWPDPVLVVTVERHKLYYPYHADTAYAVLWSGDGKHVEVDPVIADYFRHEEVLTIQRVRTNVINGLQTQWCVPNVEFWKEYPR